MADALSTTVNGGGQGYTGMIDLSVFEALPDAKSGRGRAWTTDEDDVLRRFWMVKRQADVARLLRVSEDTARKRYRELTGEIK